MVLSPPPNISLSETALFLDLDGTLAPIEPNPWLVSVSSTTTAMLGVLSERTEGAVAIVSGRTASEIDRLLQPFRFPIAAVHGTMVRVGSGTLINNALPRETIVRMTKAAQKALNRHPGILIEPKDGAVAIHYRSCPQYGPLCRAVARHISGLMPNTICLAGKMVVEIVPEGVSKGHAIKQLLSTPPFRGRIPVFAGDDLTDESGFSVVDDCGGVSIKVGAGLTSARWRLDGPEAVSAWLSQSL